MLKSTQHKEQKADYHAHSRSDLLPYVEGSPKRILDIGCGEGHTCILFKTQFEADFTAGIELSQNAAEKAASRLDKVYTMDLNKDEFMIDEDDFDLVIMSDIIEHLAEPGGLLKIVRSIMKSGGQAVVSIPNVRNWRVLFMLFFKGDWKYEQSGIMDKTHLRFFTRKSAARMLKESGYIIRKTGCRIRPKDRIFNILTLCFFKHFFVTQYYFNLGNHLEDLS